MIDFEPTDEQQLIIDTVRQFAQNESAPAGARLRRIEEAAREGARAGARARARRERAARVRGRRRRAQRRDRRARRGGAGVGRSLDRARDPRPGLCRLSRRGVRQRTQQKSRLGLYTGSRFVPGSLAWSSRASTPTPFRPKTTARRDGAELRARRRQVLRALARRRRRHAGRRAARAARRRPSWCRATRRASRPSASATWASSALPDRRADARGRARAGDARARRRRRRRSAPRAEPAAASRWRRSPSASRAPPSRSRATTPRSARPSACPIATKQAIAFKLADMAIEIDGARLLAWEAAWKLDQGEDATREALLAKRPGASASRSRSPTAPSRSSAATATSATTCPRCTCATPAASPASKPWRSSDERADPMTDSSPFEPRRASSHGAIALRALTDRHHSSHRRQRMHKIALEQMRPISREVRRARARPAAGSGWTRCGSAGPARAAPSSTRDPATASSPSACRPRSCAGATPASTCASPDAGARRLGGRGGRHARAAASASCRRFREPASPSGAPWRSPSRRPAPTPRRSRPPPSSTTATSGC